MSLPGHAVGRQSTMLGGAILIGQAYSEITVP
jgi:hypothetical protein